MTAVEDVLIVYDQITKRGRELVTSKGHDYSGLDVDTFRNIRLAPYMGLVDSPQASVLVRMCDKMMRLTSLRNPTTQAQVKEENIRDTVVDLVNYAIYFYVLYMEETKRLAENI